MPFGLFEYLFMLLGLSNAAQTFQRMMDCTTDSLECVFAYIDDCGLSGHLHLEAFFAINPENLFLQCSLWRFLTTRFQRQDLPAWLVTPLKSNHAPPPGHQATATFSRHGEFLPPFCAQLLTGVAPLTDLLKGGPKTLELTGMAQEAFQNAKLLLAAAVPLQHPAPQAEISLATDASDTHIGGVKQQKSGDHLASFSES